MVPLRTAPTSITPKALARRKISAKYASAMHPTWAHRNGAARAVARTENWGLGRRARAESRGQNVINAPAHVSAPSVMTPLAMCTVPSAWRVP